MSVGCVLLYETMRATATATPLNRGITEQNNSCARALQFFVHFFVVLCKTTTWNDQILRRLENVDHDGQIFHFLFSNSSLCSGFSFVIVLTVINKLSDFRVSWDSKINHREHTILLSRERVNKGTKRMNSLRLSPHLISSILRDFTGKTCLQILRNPVALNSYLGLSALSKNFFGFV